MTKAEKCFMLLSAIFQFIIVNFKQLYLLVFLLKMSETCLSGNRKKSHFTRLKLEGLWSYRLGDIGQKIQHMQGGIVSAAT